MINVLSYKSPRSEGRHKTGAMPLIGCALIAVALIHGCGKAEEEDPVAQIRGLIPQLSEALNQRNIGGLRQLGTGNLQANTLIIETFQGAATGNVTIGFQRVHMDEGRTELVVTVTADNGAARTLSLFLKKKGKWRLDSFAYAD